MLSGVDDVDWPHSIKELQRNWIGRSEGANVLFELPSIGKELEVFTTRHDTLFGATYIVIAPEHPLVKDLVIEEQKTLVNSYIEKTSKKSDFNKHLLTAKHKNNENGNILETKKSQKSLSLVFLDLSCN